MKKIYDKKRIAAAELFTKYFPLLLLLDDKATHRKKFFFEELSYGRNIAAALLGITRNEKAFVVSSQQTSDDYNFESPSVWLQRFMKDPKEFKDLVFTHIQEFPKLNDLLPIIKDIANFFTDYNPPPLITLNSHSTDAYTLKGFNTFIHLYSKDQLSESHKLCTLEQVITYCEELNTPQKIEMFEVLKNMGINTIQIQILNLLIQHNIIKPLGKLICEYADEGRYRNFIYYESSSNSLESQSYLLEEDLNDLPLSTRIFERFPGY